MGRLGTIILVALIVMSAGPAFAQKKTADDLINDARKQKDIDDAYKTTFDRIKERGPAPAADPWGNVREPVQAEKKSKAPAKTGAQ